MNFFSTHRNSTEVVDAVYETSAYDLEAIQVSVEGEIARNYVEFQALLGRWIAERHAQTQASILKIVEGRPSAGKGTVFEIERARVLLAYARTASLRMNAERVVALDCLAVLLGRSPPLSKHTCGRGKPIGPAFCATSTGSMCALLNNYCAAGRTSPPSKGVWWAPHPKPGFLSKICFQE
jgi:hypothetical protein